MDAGTPSQDCKVTVQKQGWDWLMHGAYMNILKRLMIF